MLTQHNLALQFWVAESVSVVSAWSQRVGIMEQLQWGSCFDLKSKQKITFSMPIFNFYEEESNVFNFSKNMLTELSGCNVSRKLSGNTDLGNMDMGSELQRLH